MAFAFRSLRSLGAVGCSAAVASRWSARRSGYGDCDGGLDEFGLDIPSAEERSDVKAPGQFDTIVTGNLFGDILSDQASACVGSIGLLASASLGERQTEHGTFGLYEPIHGSAPDIAGQGKANPVAAVLSLAMLLRHSLGREDEAVRVERAVEGILADGVFGGDLGGNATTGEIGDAIVSKLLTIS